MPASEPNKGKQTADWEGRPPFARGLTSFADLTGPVVLSSSAQGAQPSWYLLAVSVMFRGWICRGFWKNQEKPIAGRAPWSQDSSIFSSCINESFAAQKKAFAERREMALFPD